MRQHSWNCCSCEEVLILGEVGVTRQFCMLDRIFLPNDTYLAHPTPQREASSVGELPGLVCPLHQLRCTPQRHFPIRAMGDENGHVKLLRGTLVQRLGGARQQQLDQLSDWDCLNMIRSQQFTWHTIQHAALLF